MRSFLPLAALLGVALVLGCQDVGTGPDGLVPQFAKPGACDIPVHPSCKTPPPPPPEDPPPPPGGATFTVTVTNTTDISGSGVTTPVSGGEIILDPFTLNFPTFFLTNLTCGIGATIGTSKPGSVFIASGTDHTHFFFSFEHNGAGHTLALLGDKPNTWPPAPGNPVTLTANNGEWEVGTKGKNHKKGCTGAGGGGVNDITWTLTIVPQ